MSKEKVKVKQWPFDATMDFINGSGFDSSTIRRLNAHGTEEQKSNFIHERRKDAALGALALGVLVGSSAIYGEVAHGKVWGYQYNSAPTEQHGDHHGVSHNIQPGVGTMHTKNGDFNVTQK